MNSEEVFSLVYFAMRFEFPFGYAQPFTTGGSWLSALPTGHSKLNNKLYALSLQILFSVCLFSFALFPNMSRAISDPLLSFSIERR